MENGNESKRVLWQRTVVRIYVNGFLLMAILYLVYRIVAELSPWLKFVDNPFLGFLITLMVALLVPPILGCFVLYGINPLLGRWNTWSQLINVQDRLLNNLSRSADPEIVLVNWPDREVRTMGIVTTKFPPSGSSEAMCSVYIPMAPNTKSGYIRVVPLSAVQKTNWSLSDFQLFQMTFGSLNPSTLFDE